MNTLEKKNFIRDVKNVIETWSLEDLEELAAEVTMRANAAIAVDECIANGGS